MLSEIVELQIENQKITVTNNINPLHMKIDEQSLQWLVHKLHKDAQGMDDEAPKASSDEVLIAPDSDDDDEAVRVSVDQIEKIKADQD